MFAGYPLAGAPFAGDGQSNIAIAVTGVSASGYIGTVKTGIAVQPTSVVGTVSLGTAVAQANADVIVSGVSAATALDSVTVYLQKQVAVAGVQAANDVGTVTTSAKSNTTLTGVNATAYLGEVEPDAQATASPTGVSAAISIGTVEIDGKANVTVDPQIAQVRLRSVEISSDNIISVTGFQLTMGLGDEGIRIDTTVELGTLYAYGEVGTVDPDAKATVYVTGVSATCRTSTPLVWGIIDTSQNPNWVPIAA